MPAAMAAVKDGMGLGMFLSYMVEKELRSGELQTVLEPFEPQPIPVHVVFSSTKLMSTRVRAFVDWLTLELRRQFEG
jgi:DNA-binding transcriptional LysR family regulator